MATNSSLNREAVLAARQALQPLRGGGWSGGFGNMFGKELGEWFGRRRWIVQSIIWLSIINGFMAFILFVVPRIDPGAGEGGGIPSGPEALFAMGLTLFFSFVVQAGTIGAIIIAQDEIIKEKQSGTAAWILSKPAARPAFILAKLISAAIGVAVFIVALPGAVAYAEIYLASGRAAPVLPYLAGAGVALLALVFYLALVIMLGVLFEQRGPVLGLAFGLMFLALVLVNFAPQIAYIYPVNMQDIALAVAQGQPLPAVALSQVIATAAWCLVFTGVALWSFNRQEF